MEATRFSETSVYDKPNQHHISQQGILQTECLSYAEGNEELRNEFSFVLTEYQCGTSRKAAGSIPIEVVRRFSIDLTLPATLWPCALRP
jgi:hypothetical protein